MSPTEWTTDEQANFLQSYMSEYLTYTDEKRYHRFWPMLYAAWFSEWPERAECFPNVAGPLTTAQESYLGEEIESRKLQLRTWFRWRANASRMNRMESSTSCKTSVFARFLNRKPSRNLSEVELFMQEYYGEKIKPRIKADQDAGMLTSRGEVLKASRKLAKKLLKEADDTTKRKIKTMYELQKKKKAEASESAKAPDPAVVGQAIDQLPYALAEIAALIRQCCGFAVSFYCAGPDPSKNWEITSISCHPDVTSQGNTFAQLYSGQDAAMVSAFRDFAETLFPVSERGTTSAESGSDHLVSNHDGEDDAEGETDETVQGTEYFQEREGSQGFVAHDSGPVCEEQLDDNKGLSMVQNQNAFENIDLSDASLGVGDAWVTAPCDASYGLNNAFYTHTQPPMSNVAVSQLVTGSVPLDNFQNSTPSSNTTAGSSYTTGFSNSVFTPSWDYSSLYSFPDSVTSNVRSTIGDGPEGVGEVHLPPVPTHFSTDGPCLPAPTAHFGVSQPHLALPTLPVPPQSQVAVTPATDVSLPTGRSKARSRANKCKAPVAMAPKPLVISPESQGISVDTSLPAAKPRPRPRVIRRKVSVPGPVKSSVATTPMVPIAPNSADLLAQPVPPVKNSGVAIADHLLPTHHSDPTHVTSPALSMHNTAIGVDSTELTGPRASKRVPKKSTRNEEANAIGTNGPGSSQLPNVVSRKGKRAAGGAQGRPSKKPKAK